MLFLFVKRDIVTVYKQTILGPLWYIIQPLFTSVIFTLIFNNLANSLGLNGYIQNQNNKNEVEAIIQGNIKDILNITEKCKLGPELALVEDVIPCKIFCNVIYSRFIVKYDN